MLTIFYTKHINNKYVLKIRYWFGPNKSLALNRYILYIDKFKYDIHEYVKNNKPNVIFYNQNEIIV